MAIRRPPSTFSDELTASDLAANSVTASELADNAVDTAAVADNAINTAKIATNAVTATEIAANAVGESELSVDYTAQSVPHIIPGVLHPAVEGKTLSGVAVNTAHGSTYTYGTTINDGTGLKYYYTDIKGSKPIKDPRIGAHFGSQRHKAKSVQLLEQETATHGKNVYSIDGREWMRAVGGWGTIQYSGNGHFVDLDANSYANDHSFIEIVGYFNDANMIKDAHHTSNDVFGVIVNGGTREPNDLALNHTTAVLGGRYVDAGSLANLSFNSAPTLGINTLKIGNTNGAFLSFYGIELIAQDTTSTARRSEIKIPKQNVVSFGKKFEVGSDDLDNAVHPHYDPFTTMSYGGSGTTASALANLIDTATSLGMDNWKAGTSNYHRPWNGGRVVKWVDSSGTIKTSVNMMPPNAQNISTTASNAVSDAHVIAGTNDDTINFNTSPVDNLQSEVAKNFFYREFGNGAANGGPNSTYADASMLKNEESGTYVDDIAYVMDDGLTSLFGDNVYTLPSVAPDYLRPSNASSADGYYITFIGTGFTLHSTTHTQTLVQNLPYGTHVVRVHGALGSSDTRNMIVDGVTVFTGHNSLNDFPAGKLYLQEVTFHQPKRPPIPEDCVVLADYMLMADFVPQTATGLQYISKGVRRLDASRDCFYDGASVTGVDLVPSASYKGLGRVYLTTDGDGSPPSIVRIPSFGRGGIVGYASASDKATNINFKINGTLANGTTNYSHYHDGTAETDGTFTEYHANFVTGKFFGAVHKTEISSGGVELSEATASKQLSFECIDLVTPTHSSSHYQSFETPLLHELVGGDRNMEQHNLVCSPDGKSWDEVTRDTSYIGNMVCSMNTATATTWANRIIFDDWRGFIEGKDMFNKDFAIAYNALICLKTGFYLLCDNGEFDGHREWYLNGAHLTLLSSGTSASSQTPVFLQRGDYLYFQGDYGIGTDVNRRYTHTYILRNKE